MSSTVETASDIRPFHVDIPDDALEDLRRRIAARTAAMLHMGLEDEVRMLLAKGYPPTLPALQSVGYGEIVAYLAGQWDLAHAGELIERHTWQLAKRQMTWFRRVTGIHWISLTDTPETTAKQIIQNLLAQAWETPPGAFPRGQPQDQGEPCTCPMPM